MTISTKPASINRPIVLALLASITGIALLAPPTEAQERRRMVIAEDEGGPEGEHVTFFSAPDIQSLRQPDFVRTDLPIFNDKLHLDTTQSAVVKTLLEAYLESFKTAADSLVPEEQGLHMVRFNMNEAAGAAAPAPGNGAPEGPAGFGDDDDVAMFGDDEGGMDADYMLSGMEDGEFQGAAIAINVGVEAPGPNGEMAGGGGEGGEGGAAWVAGGGDGEGAEPAADGEDGGEVAVTTTAGAPGGASVMIKMTGANGEELTDEQKKNLQEQAAKIAEQIKAQLAADAERRANGEEPQGHAAAGPFAMGSPEEMQKHFEELAARAKEFEKTKEDLRLGFVRDVQAQLVEGQMEFWPALERALVRKKTLPKGRLDGERTDLLKVLAEVGYPQQPSQALLDELNRYELDLNDALFRRNDVLKTAQRNIDKALGDRDADKALEITDRVTNLRVAVRGTNQRFAESIALALSGTAGTAALSRSFAEAAERAFHPRVYSTTRAQKAFDAVAKLDGLSEHTRSEVRSLRTMYDAELPGVNQEIRQAILNHQPKEPRIGIEKIRDMFEARGEHTHEFAFGEDGRPDDPIRKAMDKRRALDERTMTTLYALLPPEMVAKAGTSLPKIPTKRTMQPVIIQAGDPMPINVSSPQ